MTETGEAKLTIGAVGVPVIVMPVPWPTEVTAPLSLTGCQVGTVDAPVLVKS